MHTLSSQTIGIGCDILHITRIEKLIDNYNIDKVIQKFLSQEEQENLKPNLSKKEYATIITKVFTIKEACVKAFGTGFSSNITLQDLTIIRVSGQSPIVKVSQRADSILLNKFGPYKILVSISDDYPLVLAYVNLIKA